MPIDRTKLLASRMRARMALTSPELTGEQRTLMKQALDAADAALGLDDALRRQESQPPRSSPANPENSRHHGRADMVESTRIAALPEDTQESLRALQGKLQKINQAPTLLRLNGCGTTLLGRLVEPSLHPLYFTRLVWTFLWIPVLAASIPLTKHGGGGIMFRSTESRRYVELFAEPDLP